MGGAGALGADPTAGGDAAGDAGGDMDSGGDCLVSICSDGQGGYMVYPGEAPDSGGGGGGDDTSEDDADAMGAAGAAPAGGAGGGMGGAGMAGGMGGGGMGGGQPADSIGAALKLALDILKSAASSAGAPGDADSQFASGFSASKSPTPATGPAQKY
jgi:hypothetical protein